MPDQLEYRITVFGAASVGKTSLILRFIKGAFPESYQPTIEDTYSQVIQTDKNVCTLLITDTTGSNQFPAMQELAISRSDAFIFVYSLTDSQSLEFLKPMWRKIYDVRGMEIKDIPLMLVANKLDDEAHRQVPTSSGEHQAKRWTAGFLEASAKQSINVGECFQQLLALDKRRNLILNVDADNPAAARKKAGGKACTIS